MPRDATWTPEATTFRLGVLGSTSSNLLPGLSNLQLQGSASNNIEYKPVSPQFSLSRLDCPSFLAFSHN
jgi:hypothetical protein